MQQTRGELTEQAATQQKRVASGLRSLSTELSAMARGSEQPGMATDLAQQAGERANAVASWLEEREPGHVVDEITRFARQRPGGVPGPRRRCWFLAGRLGRGLKDSNDSGNNGSPQDFGNTPNPRMADTTPQGYATVPQPRSHRIRPHRATTPADTNPHPATNSRRHRATRRRHRVTRGGPVGGIGAVSAPYGGRPDDPDAPAPSLGELFGEVSNDFSSWCARSWLWPRPKRRRPRPAPVRASACSPVQPWAATSCCCFCR